MSSKKKRFRPPMVFRSNYVHPSLSSSSSSAAPNPYSHTHSGHAHSSTSTPASASASSSTGPGQLVSVNEQLHHLRLTQNSRYHDGLPTLRKGLAGAAAADALAGSPVGLQASIHADPQVNPHAYARRGRQQAQPSRRAAPGPPPPRSWLAETRADPAAVDTSAARRAPDTPPSLFYFDGLGPEAVREASLEHQCLKAMASNIVWHEGYDSFYLSSLPIYLRQKLLSYVSYYAPHTSISASGLRDLFPTEAEIVDESCLPDNENVKRLDLGASIGRSLTFKQLEEVWLGTRKTASQHGSLAISASSSSSMGQIPDSWESSISTSSARMPAPQLQPTLRFPTLTHLSLAYPSDPSNASFWTSFVRFSRHLGSLTHLSLAHFPPPTLASSVALKTGPDATAAQYPASLAAPFTGLSDGQADANALLTSLSRNTQSLQYLSLQGCEAWFSCLLIRKPAEANERRAAMSAWGEPDGGRSQRPPPTERDRDRRWRATPNPTPAASPARADRLDDGIGNEWIRSWKRITRLDLRQRWIPDDALPWDLKRVHEQRHEPAPPPAPDADRGALGQASSRVSEAAVYRGSHMTPADAAAWKQARAARMLWFHHEAVANLLEQRVRRLRRSHALPPMAVEHGWDKPTLLLLGYDEQQLFDAGF